MKTIAITDDAFDRACREFAAHIKEARESTGMTQQQFAESIGYHTGSAIHRWESGTGLPRAAMLFHLAKWMGISVDWLFGFSREKYHAQHRARTKARVA